MCSQQAFDLVVRMPALLIGVAEMPDGCARARGRVLILGANAGEVDGLARAVDGDHLAGPTLGPFRRIVALDLQALRLLLRRRMSGNGRNHDKGEREPRRVGKGAQRSAPTGTHASHLSCSRCKHGSMTLAFVRAGTAHALMPRSC